MKGIIVNDIEIAIKRLNQDADSLNSKVRDINHDFDELSKSVNSRDLLFLTSKLGLEINLMSNVKNKIAGYQNVLTNVLKSYQIELEELAKNIANQSQLHYSREE